MTPRRHSPAGDQAIPDRVAWFRQIEDCFADAAARTGHLQQRSYRIGGLRLDLQFTSDRVQHIVCPAMEHLAADSSAGEPPDFTVRLFSQCETGRALPPPPGSLEHFSPRGDIRGFSTDWLKVAFQPFGRILTACHVPERRAVVCYGDPDSVFNFERAAPLRPLLGWIMRSRGRQLVHAGAVAWQGTGVLLGGKGGSGKSNTALACLLAGLDFLSDDFCAIANDPNPVAYSLYATARTRRGDQERLPPLARLADSTDQRIQDKELYFLAPAYPRQTIAGCRLKAIFLPQIGDHSPLGLEPVSPREALLALAAVTTTLLPDAGSEVLTRLSAVVRALPAFRLRLGDDLSKVPAFIRDYLSAP